MTDENKLMCCIGCGMQEPKCTCGDKCYTSCGIDMKPWEKEENLRTGKMTWKDVVAMGKTHQWKEVLGAMNFVWGSGLHSPETSEELQMLGAIEEAHRKLGHKMSSSCDGCFVSKKCSECDYEFGKSVWNP